MSTDTNTEDRILQALEALNGRMAALEAKVDRLGEAPAAAAPTALATGGGLDALGHRLERIEQSLEWVENLNRRMPVIADGMGATAAFAYSQLDIRGIDPFERGEAALDLLEKASRPEILALLSELIDRTGSVKEALKAVDAIQKAMDDANVTPEALIKEGSELTVKMASLLLSDTFQKVLYDSLLNEATLQTIGAATRALVEVRDEPTAQMGMWALFRALSDPDVQRATDFAVRYARRFGQLLNETS